MLCGIFFTVLDAPDTVIKLNRVLNYLLLLFDLYYYCYIVIRINIIINQGITKKNLEKKLETSGAAPP